MKVATGRSFSLAEFARIPAAVGKGGTRPSPLTAAPSLSSPIPFVTTAGP